jgi:Predicted hydrolases or acyltransferases (alpha/beta hydrolase superfamily)
MDDFCEVNGQRLRFRVEGAGQPLVLVHGVGGSLEQWDGVAATLGGRYRTLRYDQRGHGQSSKPAGPYSVDDFSDDLAGLAGRVLGEGPFALAGQSLGGLVAQSFALKHPERLSALILLATVSGRNAQEQAAVEERLRIVAEGIPGAHFQNSVERWFTEAFRAANPQVIRDYAARNQTNDPKAYAAAYAVLAHTDFADRLGEIRVPTLVATGEDDRGSNPRMSRLMHERIAGSELRILPGLRHSLLIEAPGQVAGLIDDFLQRSAG